MFDIGRMFTDDMVLEMMNKEVERVREAVADNQEVPSYIAVAITDDGEQYMHGMVVYEWSSPEQKNDSVRISGYTVVMQMQKVPICIVLVSEAWALTEEVGKVSDVEDYIQRAHTLANHPKRRECYFIQALTYDGRQSTAYMPFDRVDGRKVFIQDDVTVDQEVRQVTAEDQVGLAAQFFKGAVRAAEEINAS